MDSNKLTLQMGGKFGDLDAVVARLTGKFVAIGLGGSSLLQIEQPAVPAGNLNAVIAAIRRPFGDGSQELNGAASPANWARNSAGPLIVFMSLPPKNNLNVVICNDAVNDYLSSRHHII